MKKYLKEGIIFDVNFSSHRRKVYLNEAILNILSFLFEDGEKLN